MVGDVGKKKKEVERGERAIGMIATGPLDLHVAQAQGSSGSTGLSSSRVRRNARVGISKATGVYSRPCTADHNIFQPPP